MQLHWAVGITLSIFTLSGAAAQCDREIITPSLGFQSSLLKWWRPPGASADVLVTGMGYVGLYMAGDRTVGTLATWDGTGWTDFESNLRGLVRSVDAIGVVDGQLYLTGNVDVRNPPYPNRLLRRVGDHWETAADTSLHRMTTIASWNGRVVVANSWGGGVVAVLQDGVLVPLGAAFPVAVFDLAEAHGDLFARSNNRLYRWNGTAWERFGPDIMFVTMASFGGDLYLAGSFSVPGARGIVRWDGSAWTSLGPVTGSISALTVQSAELIAFGNFTAVGGVAAVNAAAWNGQQWRSIAAPGATSTDYNPLFGTASLDGSASGVAIRPATTLLSTGVRYEGPGLWDGQAWRPFSEHGLAALPSLVVSHGGTPYIAGDYQYADGAGEGVARLVNDRFEAVGSLRGLVQTLAVDQGQLLASGHVSVGGAPATGQLLRFDGQDWVQFAYTGGQVVTAIQRVGNNLYILGGFARINDVIANRAARFDGQQWHSVPQLSNVSLSVMTASGNLLYIAADGQVRTFDGTTAVEIRRVSLETDHAIHAASGFVYLGTSNGLFRWNGQSWETVTGMGQATGIQSRGGVVYASNGSQTYRISGLTATPFNEFQIPFAEVGFSVYSAGRFMGNVGDPAGFFARFNCCPADYNRDGMLDFFDYADFVACFENTCAPGRDADFNGDGFADFFDYADYVTAFEQGC